MSAKRGLKDKVVTCCVIAGCLAYCLAVSLAPWVLVWWLLFGRR